MERLTVRSFDGIAHAKCVSYYDIIDKLAEYEEAEEQGLLLRLPCKVGDTVYRINQYAKEPIISMKVLQVRFGELYAGNKFLRIDAINDEDMGEFCYLQSEFGRNVFFAKEEAEQALARMEGKRMVSPLERALNQKKHCNDTTIIDGIMYCNKSGRIILPMFTKDEKNEECDIKNCSALLELEKQNE